MYRNIKQSQTAYNYSNNVQNLYISLKGNCIAKKSYKTFEQITEKTFLLDHLLDMNDII